jgi:hypothetical protein
VANALKESIVALRNKKQATTKSFLTASSFKKQCGLFFLATY